MKPKGYTAAIVAYITFIGLLIAYFINKEDKHPFATWHIKNMFGLVIVLFISQVMQGYYKNPEATAKAIEATTGHGRRWPADPSP